MKIALATCRALPEPDADEAPLVRALEMAGLHTALLAWDEPNADFEGYDLVVIRSTWNYFEHRAAFVAWSERVTATTRLANPASVVRWNTDKTYLADLERRGIAIVPTVFAAAGELHDVAALAATRGWDSLVIKPTVSAGSYRTARFDAAHAAHRDAQTFFDDLVHERGVMIQPFLSSVNTYGERSLVWIDGALSHAIRKYPRLSGHVESVSGEVPIAEDERGFAADVLASLETNSSELLYARVDVVRDDAGALRVMELELVEPSLFLVQCPAAVDRLVRGIERHAHRPRS